MNTMLVPGPCHGTIDQIPIHPGYEWIAQLPNKRLYFALFQRWPSLTLQSMQSLPLGYDYYIVSFHLEPVDINWLTQQKVTGPIFVLFDGEHYDLDLPGIYFLSFFYWHRQLQQMQNWFGLQEKTDPQYKFSAVCNRASQSKVWITTKLLEVARESSLIVLNSQFVEEKNIHRWQLTGNTVLDHLTEIFQNRYLGQDIKIDEFDNRTQNQQNITGNPWQPLYQNCAVHFTNESFHYSNMTADNKPYVYPGPFLTEKTLKCLLGGTAFVSVGQFETYKVLAELGLQFEYNFDLSWDLDSGNISRMESIVSLIEWLAQADVDQLVQYTQHSSQHNQNWIVSNNFFKQCERKNLITIEKINQLLS
jgi:hypothetical protein